MMPGRERTWAERAALAAACLLAAGCASDSEAPEVEIAEVPEEISRVQRADYRSDANQASAALARPPRVIADSAEALLRVDSDIDRLLPELSQARIIKSHNARWAELDLPVEEAWPVVRQFWADQGFAIEAEIPEAGIFETDWQADRAQVLGTGFTQIIDKALDRLHDTGERHKFRTRIERGDRPDTTSVYISFRGIIETAPNQFGRLPHDPTLEAEMLRRLLLAFRLPSESLATVVDLDSGAEIVREFEVEGSVMRIDLPRDDAWARVLLALDRGGFTVENKDREQGILTVVYADDLPAEGDESWFDGLFGDEEPTGDAYTVDLAIAANGESAATLSAPDGEQGAAIIALVADNF